MKPLLLAAILAIAGCSTTPKQPPITKPVFDPGAHSVYFAAGDGEIRGQAILRQDSDDRVTCAGSPVIATPATAFFRQVLELAARGQMPLVGEAVGPEYVAIVRPSSCNKDGSFSIRALPPGDWLVAASVNWKVRSVTHGGLLVYKVRLRSKETVQIVMTDRDLGVPR